MSSKFHDDALRVMAENVPVGISAHPYANALVVLRHHDEVVSDLAKDLSACRWALREMIAAADFDAALLRRGVTGPAVEGWEYELSHENLRLRAKAARACLPEFGHE